MVRSRDRAGAQIGCCAEDLSKLLAGRATKPGEGRIVRYLRAKIVFPMLQSGHGSLLKRRQKCSVRGIVGAVNDKWPGSVTGPPFLKSTRDHGK